MSEELIAQASGPAEKKPARRRRRRRGRGASLPRAQAVEIAAPEKKAKETPAVPPPEQKAAEPSVPKKRRRPRRRRRGSGAHAQPVAVPKPAAPEIPLCAICGKPITANCTIDHVVPQAIYKWHENYLERAEFLALRNRITSPRNLVKTHRRCNERKEESIVGVESLHVGETKRAKLSRTFRAVAPYIEAFQVKKRALLDSQDGRCYLCRVPLKDGGVLRRIDENEARVWEDNACVICHRCNCRVKSGDVKTYRDSRAKGGTPKKRRRRRRAAAPAALPDKTL